MNQLLLSAQILELGLIRYTPAGLPALDLMLKAESTVQEAGRPRKVSMELKAVGIGDMAKSLQQLGVGQSARFGGFLAAQRKGRGAVFHITELSVTSDVHC